MITSFMIHDPDYYALQRNMHINTHEREKKRGKGSLDAKWLVLNVGSTNIFCIRERARIQISQEQDYHQVGKTACRGCPCS